MSLWPSSCATQEMHQSLSCCSAEQIPELVSGSRAGTWAVKRVQGEEVEAGFDVSGLVELEGQ